MIDDKCILDKQLAKIVSDFGTPCFVYQLGETYRRIDTLRRAFGNRFGISYAVKSNPNQAILCRLKGRIENLDISSVGELEHAVKAGWSPELMSFTGPCKRDEELLKGISKGIGEIVVESVNEAERLSVVAQRSGIVQRILIRICPINMPNGFGVKMAGKPCQFGIDEEDLDGAINRIIKMKNLSLQGFHIYSGTQCLSADALAENYEIFIELFTRCSKFHDLYPQKLIFGAGLGIPYHDDDEPLDLESIANRINPALDTMRRDTRFTNTLCILEMGRYLIGEAGFYLTRVINKKHSRGTDFCICDGGMNHHLAACGHLGSVFRRNYQMFKVSIDKSDLHNEIRPYDLVGPLCTSIDILGHKVKFPGLDIGDIVAIKCSGAYGLTASPLFFISHRPPMEILIETVNEKTIVCEISQIPNLSDPAA